MHNEISGVQGDMQKVASNFEEVTDSLNDVKGMLAGRDTELAAHLLELASRLCPVPPLSPQMLTRPHLRSVRFKSRQRRRPTLQEVVW